VQLVLFFSGFWIVDEEFLTFMNSSQHPLYPAKAIGDVRAKPKNQKRDGDRHVDIATLVLAAGLYALPFIFMGYVRSRVRHALKTSR
jgi:hypothetical protein